MKRKLSLLAVAMAAAAFSFWWALSAINSQTLLPQPLQPFGSNAQGEASAAHLSDRTVDAAAAAVPACDAHSPGMANPAAVYCYELGYEYEIVDTAEGQYGICLFPDGSKCDEWRFLEGKCGQSYSYCARQGYDLITKTDGKNPFSTEYSVCVDDAQEIGAVTELMALSEKATRGTAPVEEGPSPPEEGAPVGTVPSFFDWRTHDGQNWMTSVKNQVLCGGCWAFSAIGTAEAVHNIAENDSTLDLDLSEEYLMSDCFHDWDLNNCCGGYPEDALRFIASPGIPDEGCLSWASGTCKGCDPGPLCNSSTCTYATGVNCANRTCSNRCGDWQSRLQTPIYDVGPVSAAEIKQHIVDRGPLAAYLYMDASWVGNVYTCTSPPDHTNHAVVIVGYDDAGGYWIVKNSWGSTWNPPYNGYFNVAYGQCLIETKVYYAADFDHAGCVSYTSSDVPKAVPDPGTVTSNLNVGDSFTLTDVNVGPLNITHAYDADLDVFLISPAGTRVELFTDVGNGLANFINTTLDDECGVVINTEWPPFRGCYRPEGSLSALDGEGSSGQWRLEVSDDYGEDAGTLDSWELELCDGPTLEPDVVVTKSDDPDPVCGEGDLTYHLEVCNIGGATATGVTVDDELPPEVTFVSASPGCTYITGVHCDLPDLAPSQCHTVDIQVTAPSVASTTVIVNDAVADAANEPVENSGNNDDSEDTAVQPCCPPVTPGTYHGDVHLNGVPAPDGTDIVASISGSDWSSATTSAGTYVMDIPDSQPEEPPCFEGGQILFQADGIPCQPSPEWSSGLHEVNLTCAGVSEAVISIESGYVAPGGDETVRLEALNVLEPGVCMAVIDIIYDPGVKTATSCLPDPDGRFENKLCNVLSDRVALTVSRTADGVTGDFPLADITFHADPDALMGSITLLDVDVRTFVDCGGTDIPVTEVDGENTIGLLGDVDCDSDMDGVDALFCLQYLVYIKESRDYCPAPPPPPPEFIYGPAADVNGDADVDGVDCLFMLQCLVYIPNVLCPEG